MVNVENHKLNYIDYITLQNHDIKNLCWSWVREAQLCIPSLKYKNCIEPNSTALVLENWSGFIDRGITPEYCRDNSLRFVVILSEHMTFNQFDTRKKHINLKEMANLNNFGPSSSNISSDFRNRLRLIEEYDEFVDYYCSIGSLPDLKNWARYLSRPSSRFIKLPINIESIARAKGFTKGSKVLFTGQVTNYRVELISSLIKEGLDIEVFPIESVDNDGKSPFSIRSLNHEEKDKAYERYDYVLDIPKDINWPYSSTIRILDTLRQDTQVIVADTIVDSDLKPYINFISELYS